MDAAIQDQTFVLAATVILRVVIVPSLGYKIQPWECIGSAELPCDDVASLEGLYVTFGNGRLSVTQFPVLG